jgi:hypothetical protein
MSLTPRFIAVIGDRGARENRLNGLHGFFLRFTGL